MVPALTPNTAVAALFWVVYLALGFVVLNCVGYLLTLLFHAGRRPRSIAAADGENRRFTIVIPAHNEELVLGATLDGLEALDYLQGRFRVVVVADNCTDSTAAIARKMGATVMERTNLTQRGKGYALEWAFAQLLADRGEFADDADAYVVVDADTLVDRDFLNAMSRRLGEGVAPENRDAHRAALQGRYGVLNTNDSWRSALMTAAFDLFNHVKPLGRNNVGLSVGLKGNGMAFTRALLKESPMQGSSITEDIDYGLDLLQKRGVAVGYAPEAIVVAQMPTTAKQSASQRERWERGRYKLMRERAFPLLWDGIRRGDVRLVDAALDLLTPPLAELYALCVAWLIVAFIGYGLEWTPAEVVIPPALALLGYVVYVLGGLKVAGAKPEAYSALLRAPLYALWKFVLIFTPKKGVKKAVGALSEEWVRTERAAMPSATNATKLEISGTKPGTDGIKSETNGTAPASSAALVTTPAQSAASSSAASSSTEGNAP